MTIVRSFPRIESAVFYLLLAANLIPLWSVHYFLTGDGPCHLYNAKVLLDMYHSAELKAFYNPWLGINYFFEPNWFSHAALEMMMGVGVAPYLAEKFLQTFYVLAFGLGLRYLIRQINPAGLFMSSFGLLLCYHHVYQMGFYNYSCSLAIMFWVVGYWLRYRSDWTTWRMLLQGLGFLVLYFCHPVGLFFAFLLIGSVLLADLLAETREKRPVREVFHVFRQKIIALTVSALPVLVLLAQYVFKKGINPTPRSESDRQIWEDLYRFTALSTMMQAERKTALLVAGLFLVLVLGALTIKIRSKRLQWTDALFVVFGLTLLIYFRQPGGIAGAGILPIRLQLLPYLMLLLWLASVEFPKWIRLATLVFSIAALAALMSIRIPHNRMASDAAEDLVSAAAVIPDRVSVLPISFDHNGRHANGEEVADAIWLFVHAADYIGTQRQVIMLDNYEAATPNFPLSWRRERNPYNCLEKDGNNFEGQPPYADFLHYPENSNNASVDYVVTWCLDRKKFGDHPFVEHIRQQLDEGYDLVYTSGTGLVKVFKSKRL